MINTRHVVRKGGGQEGTVKESIYEVVVISCADELFAFDIGNIEEIKIPPAVTPVPLTLPFVMGIVALRGDLFPVINLALFLGIPLHAETIDSRIMIFRMHDEMIGFFVDRVIGVQTFPASELMPVNEALPHDKQLYHGVFSYREGFISFLDLAGILASQQLSNLSMRGRVSGKERRADQADSPS